METIHGGEMSLIVWLTSAGMGAWLMCEMVPRFGRRRRDRVWQRFRGFKGRLRSGLWRTATLLTVPFRYPVNEAGTPDDVLCRRVRATLSRLGRRARGVAVTASDGLVILRGHASHEHLAAIFEALGRVPGVSRVDHQLSDQDPVSKPADSPALRPWTAARRIAAGATGGALAWYGLRRRGLRGVTAGLAGATLLARAAGSLKLARRTGGGTGSAALTLRETLTLPVPVERAFKFWSDYGNFPAVMSHVHEVRETAYDQTHWVVDGPGGSRVEWDAVLTAFIPNTVIAWKTVPGSVVKHTGRVRFQGNPDGTTRLDVELSYNPGAGALGDVIAALFRVDPRQQFREDIQKVQRALSPTRKLRAV